MVEESANNKENNTSSAAQNEQPKKQSAKDFIEGLFANDNYLCTMPKAKLPDGSALNINDETRRRLALFADGTLLISKDHRFDGPVLSFLSIAEKKGIKMKSPVYISQNELATIYAMAERNQVFSEDDEDLARLQMQRDFVNIIKRASSMKVSDVHVVVSDNCTEIFFRANGVMIKEMEYSKEWGDQFVRAAFASADISDANYAQNEFQGAQKLGSTPLRGSKGKLMLPHNVLAIRLQFNPIAFGSQYLVMRILYADDNPDGNDDLAALGCGEYEQDLFFRLRAAPVGLNIVAGPTGSGKSTLLQRNMIKLIKEKNGEINLLTVEDPPEYPIPGARQMPVTNANTEEEKTVQFTLALSAALRSDPDVLMVGEIRSLATASLTFKGALSGHLARQLGAGHRNPSARHGRTILHAERPGTAERADFPASVPQTVPLLPGTGQRKAGQSGGQASADGTRRFRRRKHLFERSRLQILRRTRHQRTFGRTGNDSAGRNVPGTDDRGRNPQGHRLLDRRFKRKNAEGRRFGTNAEGTDRP